MTVQTIAEMDADEAPARTERGRVSLRTLIWIRWIAVAGQAVTLLVVHLALGFTLPLEIALGVVATSAVINLANQLQRTGSLRLGDRDAMMYLAYDVVQLGALLYLTGGLQNPFSLLVLAPVTVGATILSRRSVMILSMLTVGVATILAIWHLPLPWDEDQLEFPLLYVLAVWLALTLSTLFIAAYTWSVTEEGRRISDAYAATQLALAREQRISAVGALAAAAAHELGSPLGTIAVIAKELARDLPADGPLAEDARLLLSETARCRTILQELAQKREADGGTPYDRLPLSALVEAAGEPYRVPYSSLTQKVEGNPEDQPLVARSPEIMHGLGNLVQNAVQFAIAEVVVRTQWDLHWVTVTVSDDGPGFPTQVLSRLGEPYLSGRDEDAEHMGLGIFIAETLLRRTGAKLHFANGAEGGAVVRVRWPRRALVTVAGLAVPVA
ncbi:MAG TPA: ActS/PrrB/RegB family redox-sensitive histidine kinase [Aliidongia sp.]|uniref:ActS/PrrB/RegB family redox-sensitive histidine kinase n=1 Tax=Aliidongia sp. TaxID=1914230 RepID=UPI002DDCE02F|nr:ActS/PrrB/RegB family redox-sensitive histidine kinase [Aliidongia sp.]HEV2674493.1 ActS/PrrB/RegB family redox-sensitive histidine kinase [Aliidongia sp.]